MKARNVKFASKLRELLSAILESGKMTCEEISSLYNEVIVNDHSLKRDEVVNDAKVLISSMIARGIMTKGEVQFFINEAIMMFKAKEEAAKIKAVAMAIN